MGSIRGGALSRRGPSLVSSWDVWIGGFLMATSWVVDLLVFAFVEEHLAFNDRNWPEADDHETISLRELLPTGKLRQIAPGGLYVPKRPRAAGRSHLSSI